jgi:glycine/D-amino acid oxidase-like deaminating enzyme
MSDFENLKRRMEEWAKRGIQIQLLSRGDAAERIGTDSYVGASFDSRGGAINPLAYSRGLAGAALGRGARIVQGAKVERIQRAPQGWVVDLGNGSVACDKVVIATNAHTGDFWPNLSRTFLRARTPQLVSKPLSDPDAAAILPGRETMSDTRALTVGVRVHPDGRLHLGGGGGTSGADRDGPYRTLQRHGLRLFPHLTGLEWEYRWSGFMAITPDRYPKLYSLAPGVAACLGYSGRGVAMATIMGRELARWCSGGAGLDELALPVAQQRSLPYHRVREIILEGAVLYFSLKDGIRHSWPRAG